LLRIRVPRQSLDPRFGCAKPFPEKRPDNGGDVLGLHGRRHHIPRSLVKSRQVRNFKDTKGLRCRYTFGLRAITVRRRAAMLTAFAAPVSSSCRFFYRSRRPAVQFSMTHCVSESLADPFWILRCCLGDSIFSTARLP
jgi:hypothetical protein